MITDEQKEKALKFVEAIKNATQSFKPAETDLEIIYSAVYTDKYVEVEEGEDPAA